jgi:hypothetical protein
MIINRISFQTTEYFAGARSRKISSFLLGAVKQRTDNKETDLKIRKAFLYYFIGRTPENSPANPAWLLQLI